MKKKKGDNSMKKLLLTALAISVMGTAVLAAPAPKTTTVAPKAPVAKTAVKTPAKAAVKPAAKAAVKAAATEVKPEVKPVTVEIPATPATAAKPAKKASKFSFKFFKKK